MQYQEMTSEAFSHLTPLAFAVLALASWRLTSFLIQDKFPPLERLKVKLGIARHLSEGDHYLEDVPDNWTSVVGYDWMDTDHNAWKITVVEADWIGNLKSCPYCLGFYVSLLLAGAFFLCPEGTVLVALPWALNALTGWAWRMRVTEETK